MLRLSLTRPAVRDHVSISAWRLRGLTQGSTRGPIVCRKLDCWINLGIKSGTAKCVNWSGKRCSAVDLKFLSVWPHIRHRNFESKNRTRFIYLLVHHRFQSSHESRAAK